MMVREGMYTEIGRGNSYKNESARQEQMSQ